ncbi:MAG: terpene cyclase/mutase family protein [Planctomycetaceae bacterium]|nr:terpene cyclase/mutase family protein [Planctomycetaceae bacterium]
MKKTLNDALILLSVTLFTVTLFTMTWTIKNTFAQETNISEKTRQELVRKAADYLRTSQGEDGSFSVSPRSGIGPTAIITAGLLQNGVSVTDPIVAKSLGYLKTFVQRDGGIYAPPGRIKNYETSVMILAFHLANTAGEYDTLLKDAEKFLRDSQFDELDGYSKTDPYYGGVGYGNDSRPDLSNTQFFIDALHVTGHGADDPAIQKALVFVSKCQNLKSDENPPSQKLENPDGGFFYTNAGGGENAAGRDAAGGLRSYGSMTYAGLKSMIFAGLTSEDPRVKAAEDWLKERYQLDENPGLGKRGLYYYYQTMGNTLSALGKEFFVTKDGTQHHWKQELIETLAKKQQTDGSWVNTDPMWMENDPNLVTGFVLMVLADCK